MYFQKKVRRFATAVPGNTSLAPIFVQPPKRKGGQPSLPFDRTCVSSPGCLGLLRDLRKRCLVVHREIGEHLAVDVDRRLLEAIHERAVRKAKLAHRGVDARDPQRAELAFSRSPVAILVLPRLHHRFLRDAIDVVAPAAVALGLLDHLLVPRAGGHATFDSWHGALPTRRAALPRPTPGSSCRRRACRASAACSS